jgi:hypothetical protein
MLKFSLLSLMIVTAIIAAYVVATISAGRAHLGRAMIALLIYGLFAAWWWRNQLRPKA